MEQFTATQLGYTTKCFNSMKANGIPFLENDLYWDLNKHK